MEAGLTPRIGSNWSSTVLVCRKCSKRLGGGFGPKGTQPLAKALRKHLGLRKGRKGEAGIVEVKCLGVCPPGAVTVINGAAAREWLLVPMGTDLDDVARELGILRNDGPPGGADDVAPSPATYGGAGG